MTAVVLAVFAVAVVVGAHRLIGRFGWVSRAPRLGLLAWLATAFAGMLAAVAAGVALVAHGGEERTFASAVLRLCVDALLGAHGPGGQTAALVASLLLLAGLARLATAWWQVVAGAARRRRAHRAMLRLAEPGGGGGGDLTVLPHPEPVAYLVAGRRPRVVVSTTTLEALSPAELAAVLAHERAHAAGRHHWLLAAGWLLPRAFPGVPLFAHAARATARLVEMCADDAATRRHSRLALARALVAMAAPAPTPAAVLHTTGGDAVERLARLLDPPRPLPAPVRLLLAASFGLLPLLPVLILASGPAWPMLAGAGG